MCIRDRNYDGLTCPLCCRVTRVHKRRHHLRAPPACSFRPSDHAAKNVLNTKLTSNLLHRLGRFLIRRRASAIDDAHTGKACKLSIHCVGQTVDKIVLLCRTLILERQNREHYSIAFYAGIPAIPQEQSTDQECDSRNSENRPHPSLWPCCFSRARTICSAAERLKNLICRLWSAIRIFLQCPHDNFRNFCGNSGRDLC